jgi:spermidine synthase
VALYGLVGVIGILVGLEIPLLMRILHGRYEFKDLVSRVFSFDYLGALLASVLFPLVLVPRLGLVRTGFLFGLVNVLVAAWTARLLRQGLPWARSLLVSAAACGFLLAVGFAGSERLQHWAEAMSYPEPVLYARSSPYQRLVVTQGHGDLRLYLNGNLQFSSRDEYRYHEALVHPGLAMVPNPRRVLVLGGGDGLAVRELLRHPGIDSIVLVDLDSAVTHLFSASGPMARLNGGALASAKLRVVHADAFAWLQGVRQRFDFAVVDFPDPGNFSVGKLFSTAFYKRLAGALAPGGAAVIQSTSPYVARKSYWCVVHTLEAAGFRTLPYHAYVPSFGEWGFVLAAMGPLGPMRPLPAGLRFLREGDFADLARFPPDMDEVPTEVNRLDNQTLVRYFEAEWAPYQN